MAPPGKIELEKMPLKGVQALKSLSVEFVSHVTEGVLKGETFDALFAAFSRHQAKIVSGVLGSVGIAGGTWAAISLWTSSLGLWSTLGYSLGILSMPVWVPVAGGVAGLTAAGGAVYGVLSLVRSRGQTRKLRTIIGFSKMLIGKEELDEEDERRLREILTRQQVEQQKIEQLLRTTPEQARALAGELNREAGPEIARYLYPLVYFRDGVVSSSERRRFARICSCLGLEAGEATRIAAAYRQRLDAQWAYLENIILQLNHFVRALAPDLPAVELLREQLAQLMRFDPRRASAARRERTLRLLSAGPGSAPHRFAEDEILDEAALMGAYALAQTIAPEPETRQLLEAAFDELLETTPQLSDEYKKKMITNRRKVEKLYDFTREQILTAVEKEKTPSTAPRIPPA
jgi:hypothetical protein